ncbi:MAG: ribonuclease P protein component [Alphaproteobacteria bacterium]
MTQDTSTELPVEVLRLKNRKDFLSAHRYGRKHVSDGFLIQCRKRRENSDAEPDHAQPRLGFTASKKVGNSVARSRAKRRLRALAHDILTREGLIKPARDYVLIARPETLVICFETMKVDLRRALEKLEKPQSNYRPKTKNTKPKAKTK